MSIFDKLNKANDALRTVNNTTSNVRHTKQNVDSLGGTTRRMQQQKAAKKAADKAERKANEWKCECGAKSVTKFCGSCGKAKPACDNCGAAATGAKFCGECGAAME